MQSLVRAESIRVVLSLALVASNFSGQLAKSAESTVEVVPAVRVSKGHGDILKQNNKLLHSNQQLIDRVLSHLKISYYVPVLPKYHLMSENSVLGLLNQTYYADLAKKLDAPIPKSHSAESGNALSNNVFLHGYNNEILRSIAKKLDVKVPEKLSRTDALASQSNKLIMQNHEILTAIASKLGVK